MAVSGWSCDDVKAWLISEGFDHCCSIICDEHGVDGEVLLSLTEEDLRSPPLQLQKLGVIKKLGKCLQKIQEKNCVEHQVLPDGNVGRHPLNSMKHVKKSRFLDVPAGDSDDDLSDALISDNESRYKDKRKKLFLPEYKKLLVSLVYAFVASWITAYMMVIVHERVPDKVKYPPLPDIFLDNVPLIPYAFQLAEACGLILASMFLLILIFHKHRAIILRRFFSIASTIFLLRSVTMFVTSLSVPGEHLQCAAMYNSMWQRISRATTIVFGFGMSITGVHTCGDYMFSGHTAYLTLFNHLITEYTPLKMYLLHTMSWVLNLFGVFFVLAAHEHYSLDVVMALYITSRIFLYYHMMANTRSYSHSSRIKIWFPLLSYFECNVPGKVPNIFEWPPFLSKNNPLLTKLKKL